MKAAVLLLLIGVTAARISPRIINGDMVQDMKTKYPYMASLTYFRGHSCGGILIAPDVILTAAHCMKYVNEVQLLRFNRTDEETPYESYLMKSKLHHPRYYEDRYLDNDPHDIALISFYGRTSLEPAKLNRDPSLPSSTSDDLLIVGWGTLDPDDLNTASEVLQEGTVKYIPNEVCASISGQSASGANVSYGYGIEYGVIAPQNLCAADFETFQDICNGDSGGPILLNENTVAGVTSFSVDCASSVFPAVYVRTSAVMDWIDDQICKMSQYELPSEFECIREEQPNYGDENVTISFQFQYNVEPGETGWVLSSESTGDLAHASIFHYNDVDPKTTITEVISIPNHQEYTLTLLQRWNNGRGQVRVYEGTDGIKNSSAIYLSERLNIYEYSTPTYTFVVGELPTTAPTATSAPSITEPSRPFISIEIVLDDFPSEIGWSVTALSEDDESLLVDVRYPGAYANLQNGTTVMEIAYLLPSSSSSSPQKYEFMITDNEGDGICPTYVIACGRVRVYWGDVADGHLLFENKPYEFEDVHYFFEILPTSSPTSSPSPTIAPFSAPPSESLSGAPSVSVTPASSKKGGSKKTDVSSSSDDVTVASAKKTRKKEKSKVSYHQRKEKDSKKK